MTLKIEEMNIDDLIPYAGNTRKHDAKNVSDIASSIAAYGFNDPIAVNAKDCVIVEGHGRLLAAKKLGMLTVPVIKLDHLSPSQIKAYTIVHNRMAEKSSWDIEMLKTELEVLNEMSTPLTDLGFAIEDLNRLGIKLDFLETAPEVEKGTNPTDPNEEWEGMPDFDLKDKSGYKTIHVHFETKEDYENFAQMIDQPLTDKTRSIWYPEQKIEKYMDKVYE